MKLLSGAEIQCPLSVLQRVRIIDFFFFLRKYIRILSGHWKLSVKERCPYWRGVRTKRFDCNKNATKLTGGIM